MSRPKETTSNKKRKRKNKKKNYFNEEVEQKVVEYLECTDQHKKNKIFKDHLEYPLYKLVEGIINKYQLQSREMSFEELHGDTLSFLIKKMDKFDPSLGYKAYSYYGTIVVRRLRYIQKEENERQKKHIQYDDSFQEDDRFSYQIEQDDQEVIMLEVFKEILKEIDFLLKINEGKQILKEEERIVAVAIVEVMSNWDEILSDEEGGLNRKYEKNKILMCLRDITGFSTKDIRKHSKRFKKLYYECKKEIIEEY